MCNTDHIPVHIDMDGNYSCDENNTEGRQGATGGKKNKVLQFIW